MRDSTRKLNHLVANILLLNMRGIYIVIPGWDWDWLNFSARHLPLSSKAKVMSWRMYSLPIASRDPPVAAKTLYLILQIRIRIQTQKQTHIDTNGNTNTNANVKKIASLLVAAKTPPIFYLSPRTCPFFPPIDTLCIIVCNRPKAHMYESSVECGRFLQIVATNKQHHLALLDHSQCEPQPLPQETTSENIVRLSLR